MENEFTKAMAKLSDAELLKVCGEQKGDYVPEAIVAAEAELAGRNLTTQQIETANYVNEQKKMADDILANEHLSVIWKIFAFISPGWLLLFFSAVLKAEGYATKAKELKRWTIYGFCFYLGIAVLTIILDFII